MCSAKKKIHPQIAILGYADHRNCIKSKNGHRHLTSGKYGRHIEILHNLATLNIFVVKLANFKCKYVSEYCTNI